MSDSSPDPAAAAPSPATGSPRLETLDLIRGIAVLGILAINIAGFAGPTISLISPNLPDPVSPADEAAFAFSFLLFEGKMRALFSLLFGAGIGLFWERAEAAGRDGDILQLRRLGWLLLLGMAHYLLLWWGDILFLYAVCGLAALILRPLGTRTLLGIALGLYYLWHVWGLLDTAPLIDAETALRHGAAPPAQQQLYADWIAPLRDWADEELRESRLGFFQLASVKLTQRPLWQIDMVFGSFAETLPMMLIGMVLYRSGFFAGGVPRSRLIAVGAACTGAGLALTAVFLGWAWPRHFPPAAMHAALLWGMAMPHLLCGCGYAALLVLATRRLAATCLGHRLIAAGRVAFSNYILTSVVMCFGFYGWGLGLFGTIGPAAQWLFVAGGWALMLAWSEPWLLHFQRGPLEWLWRCLIERRALENIR